VKPSYEDLVKRVRELESEIAELRRDREELDRKASTLDEVEELALLGHWELDIVNDTLSWSDEIYRIFDLEPQEFGATYEHFIEQVHPDDRDMVNEAYTTSVRQRTGYDIVHRLLLKDGRVRYVNERCRTEYDEAGSPVRSLGTVQDITETMRASKGFSGIVGREPCMQELFEMIRKLSEVGVPVLIQGESGTGKELVARAIHDQSHRSSKAFVPVNCGALPDNLLESELFGHVRGAFTGAVRDKKGRFELADGGTLFLDEVADMPLPVQAKLLRVLQEHRFERLGGEGSISVDVRVLSASNKDLKTEVEQGRFRGDLFYRLKVVPVHLPPLRERRNDIPMLVEHFLETAAREGHACKGISRDALALLVGHSWPGNVRELQSAISYAIIKSRREMILPEHLPLELMEMEAPAREKPRRQVEGRRGRPPKLDEDSVERALREAGGSKVKAARILGVGRATLYRYLKSR
jgi:PAS domain S-box-containing protein